MKVYFVYILKCSDNSYYTGITSNLSKRYEEHRAGRYKNSYTFSRRPLKLVYYGEFTEPDLAIEFEKKIKKWSRKKKEALIEGRFEDLPKLSRKKFD